MKGNAYEYKWKREKQSDEHRNNKPKEKKQPKQIKLHTTVSRTTTGHCDNDNDVRDFRTTEAWPLLTRSKRKSCLLRRIQ